MPGKINIAIPTPCHENWDAMTPAEKGRFCGACQKHVYDFTQSSDREIALALKNNNTACGRLRNKQLNRDLLIPKETNPLWVAASTVVISVIALGSTEAVAQKIVPTEQHLPNSGKENTAVNPEEQLIEVNGVVYDSQDNGSLSGVLVSIKNSDKSVQTDIDGKFSILAKENDILLFDYIGSKQAFHTVTKSSNNIDVPITFEDVLVGEIVFVDNRTFFTRIFHSIGNWFR